MIELYVKALFDANDSLAFDDQLDYLYNKWEDKDLHEVTVLCAVQRS